MARLNMRIAFSTNLKRMILNKYVTVKYYIFYSIFFKF